MSASSILGQFDADTTGSAARIETRRRELALPVTSLYRWWARRTAAVTTGLLDATLDATGKQSLTVLDPFAGGGVIALSALLAGHRVVAQEIDPWAARNLALMSTPGFPDELDVALEAITGHVAATGDPYLTTNDAGAPARMLATLRVASVTCSCRSVLTLYPAAVVSRTARVDRNRTNPTAWFACKAGHLHHHAVLQHPCPECHRRVRVADRYTTGRQVTCHECGRSHQLADLMKGGVTWEPVLVVRLDAEGVREYAEPAPAELAKINTTSSGDVHLGQISEHGETAVLARHGFCDFADLYPDRQLQVLTGLLEVCDRIDGVSDWARAVARSCVIGAAEFAGLATRWDPSYLKPYETISSHRYALTTLSAELDPLGALGRGTIPRRIKAARDAATWLGAAGVPAGVRACDASSRRRRPAAGLTVVTGGSQRMPLTAASVDLILTDPPFHDDVQYADLASLFRAWSGDGVGRFDGDAAVARSRSSAVATEFESALTDVFRECRRVVKPDGHLVLSFANRDPKAWAALIAALDSAGWQFSGFDVVHAENETDHAKRGRRSCNLDVIVDLTPTRPKRRHRPRWNPVSAEQQFCFAVGRHLWDIGRLRAGWRQRLAEDLESEPFLSRVLALEQRSAG